MADFDEYEHEGKRVKIPKGTEPTEELLDSLSQEQEKIQKQEAHTQKRQEAVSMSELAFPRASRAIDEGKSFFAKSIGAGMDALSAPLRFSGAMGRSNLMGAGPDWGYPSDKSGNPIRQDFSQALGQINQGLNPRGEQSLVSGAYNDPTVLPMAASGIAAAGWILKGGNWIKNLGRASTVAGAEGLGSGLVHQVEDVVLKNEKFSPGEVAAETAVSAAAPAVIGGAMVAPAKFGNWALGKLASQLSNVSEATLRKWGTGLGKGAKELRAIHGKQKEIGDKILGALENFDDYIPEKQIVDKAVEKMPPISLENTIQVLEDSKISPRKGGRLLPHEVSANSKIDGFIRGLQGDNPTPAQVAASDLKAVASKSGVMAGEAEKSAEALKSVASNELGYAKVGATHAENTAGVAGRLGQKVQGEKGFYSWSNPETLKNAKRASESAQEALITADARAAAGGLSQEDANAARHVADVAKRTYATADAALQLSQGKSLEDVGKSLIKDHGISGEGLQSILKKARDKSSTTLKQIDHELPANQFRGLRKGLDVNIDFTQEGSDIVNRALKNGRLQMKNDLIAAAESSGNPEYVEAMKSWTSKLGKRDAILEEIGANAKSREKKVGQFLSTLFNKNKETKQKALADISEVFGEDFVKKAKLLQMSDEIIADGSGNFAKILPNYPTGKAGTALTPGAAQIYYGVQTGSPGMIASGIGTAGAASPMIGSKMLSAAELADWMSDRLTTKQIASQVGRSSVRNKKEEK